MLTCMGVMALSLLEEVSQATVKDKAVGFFQGIALKGLMFASEHPIWTGLIGGVSGMLIVYAFRRALWATLKWAAWDIPTTVLGVVLAPVVALYRKVRGRTPGGSRVSRLPLIGETAYAGPCRNCGTKREYRVRTSGYSGGAVRGIDTMTGTMVLGCADCVKA